MTAALLASSATFAVSPQTDDDRPIRYVCFVAAATAHRERFHIVCANKGLNGLFEFSAEAGQPYTRRVAAAAEDAIARRMPLTITYAPSSFLNPEGCLPATCRKIIDVGERPPLSLAPPPPSAAQPLEPQKPLPLAPSPAQTPPAPPPQAPLKDDFWFDDWEIEPPPARPAPPLPPPAPQPPPPAATGHHMAPIDD